MAGIADRHGRLQLVDSHSWIGIADGHWQTQA
jgi:hypothetical protein